MGEQEYQGAGGKDCNICGAITRRGARKEDEGNPERHGAHTRLQSKGS